MATTRKFWTSIAAAVGLVLTVIAPARADNPIVQHIYTADPSPLVHNGRVYLYTGHDEDGSTFFTMREWRVWSSADMVNWTDHGSPMSLATFSWAKQDAWAGQAVERNGKFYWYVPVVTKATGRPAIGVGVSDSPTGPFRDAIGRPLVENGEIDPSVMIDDDGQAYLYWGSYWGARAAKLKPNMIELDGPVVTPQGLADFWEAPFMFKRNGLYYMMYAANDTNGCVTSSSYACQRYATATNPMGPWTHRGVVLGQVSSTTNHAGVAQFNGQWYMVYHNAQAPGGGNYRRSVAVDLLNFNADGTMQRVNQTTTGPPPNPGTPTGNIALGATATTSYVSPWENLAAVNNGSTPASSADRSNLVYGNWPERGTQWLEYTWPSARSINRTSVYWFDDDQGIDLPASCRVQYWTGSAYADVPGQSACGTAANAFNSVTFPTVSTTRLRLSVTARADYSTGVLEWQAFAA